MDAVNLIPASRFESRQRRTRLRRWASVCAGYAAFLVLTFIITRFVESGDARAVRDRLEETTALAESSRTTVAAMRATLADLNEQRRRNLAVGVQPDWSLVLAELARNLGQEVVLQQCRLESVVEAAAQTSARGPRTREPRVEASREETLRLELAGFGRTQASVTSFLLRLEDTELFTRVIPVDTQREPFGVEYAVAFRIECILNTDVMPEETEEPAS